MLVAGSETVRQIHDRQGKKEAIAFAQHTLKIASQQHEKSVQSHRLGRGHGMGD
jgi:hypothetical protein